MPMQPIKSNPFLTNAAVAYIQEQDQFIADRIFPVVSVSRPSGKFPVFGKSDLYRIQAEEVVPGGQAPDIGNITTSSVDFSVSWYWQELALNDITLAIFAAEAGLDLKEAAARIIAQGLLLKREQDFFSSYFTTGVWGTDHTPTNKWDDETNGTPVDDITTAIETVLENTGFRPNVLVLSEKAFNALKKHPQVKDLIKYGGAIDKPAVATERTIAQIFGLEDVLVARAVYETAAKGATSSMSFVAGKNALLIYRPKLAAPWTPSAGYTLVENFTGAKQGVALETYRDDRRKADVVRGVIAYAFVKVAADLGYFFSNVVS